MAKKPPPISDPGPSKVEPLAGWEDDRLRELVDRLARYAHYKIARLRWRGVPYARGGRPPGGVSPEDLAVDAVVMLINGARPWNRDRYPTELDFLKSVVDSLVNHLAESAGNRLERNPGPPREGGDAGTLERRSTITPGPLQVATDRDELARFQSAIRAALDGDSLAVEILQCLEQGFDKPSEMAELLGKPVKDINNAQVRYRRAVDRVRRQLDHP